MNADVALILVAEKTANTKFLANRVFDTPDNLERLDIIRRDAGLRINDKNKRRRDSRSSSANPRRNDNLFNLRLFHRYWFASSVDASR